jgi:hypothetical protein
MVDTASIAFRADSREVRTASRDLDQMARSGGRAERSNDNLARSIRRVVGLVGGYAALRAAVRAVSDQTQTMERNMLRTEALLTATGNAAGFTATELRGMADELALATLQSVDGVQQAQQAFLQFSNVQGDVFREGISLAADLAAAIGGDVQTSALRLGRVLQNPERELNALRRQGIMFTQQQEDQVAAMMAVGDVAGAQEVVLSRLRNTIGGLAESEAAGLSGAFDTLSQRIDEFQEGLGRSVSQSGLLSNSIDAVSEAIHRMNRALFGPPDLSDRIEVEREALQEIEDQLAQQLRWHERVGAAAITSSERTIATLEDQIRFRREVIAEMEQMLDQQLQSEADARQSAADAAQQAERDRQAVIRAEQEAAGLESLARIERQLEDEHLARSRQFDEDIETIENMVVSEEETRRRGFESLAWMREHYKQRLTQQLDEEMQAESDAARDIRRMREDEAALLLAVLEGADAEQTERSRQSMELQLRNLRSFLDDRLLTYDEYHAAVEAAEAAHEQRLADIRKDAQSSWHEAFLENHESSLFASQQFFGNLAQIADAGGRKSFEAYKGMAMAEAAIAGSLAFLKALSAAPPPFNFALAGSVAAVTGVQIAQIASQEYRGAREMGGQVQAGGRFLVGERGPEILQIGSQGGHVTPNHAIGGNEINVTNVFQIGSGAGSVRQEMIDMLPMIEARSKQAVMQAISNGGPLSKATGRRA